jgi:two-component system, NarL family, sensor histidine kinase DevS
MLWADRWAALYSQGQTFDLTGRCVRSAAIVATDHLLDLLRPARRCEEMGRLPDSGPRRDSDLTSGGTAVFASGSGFLMPFRSIEDPWRLQRVLQAVLLIEADLTLPELLRHVIEEARSMTGARYGAVGVLNEDGTALSKFITVGLTPEEEERIGPRPTGKGLLGELIADPHPLRIATLRSHPESSGFPPNHPPMTSFLGVPVKVRNEVYGNLYLTDKDGSSEFTSDDQAVVESLALAAGIAIENTRLHEQAAQTAVYADRDRLARDLHDTIIQRLFAVGLTIQSVAGGSIPRAASDRLTTAVDEIDDTIRQLRTTIFELGLVDNLLGVRTRVISLLGDLRAVVGFTISLSFDGPVDTAVSDTIAEHLLATLREAVTNIGRHAKASRADVMVNVGDGSCSLLVTDDGIGMGSGEPTGGGLGLANMRRRAEKLHGELIVDSRSTGGTSLIWQVPLSA